MSVSCLISNVSLCGGYVTELKSYQQLPQKILFDWETTSTTKKTVKPLFSWFSLFDTYLTEY